jgi:thiol-disulfide isomerase/thioredoxin
MKRFAFALALGLASAAALPAVAQEQAMSHDAAAAASVGGPLAPAMQGKPVVVRIHADWCPACKATASTLDAVRAKYGTKITYVQLDVTNAKTAAAAQELAKADGLGKFFDATKTATSTVAVVDPKTGAVIGQFYNDTNEADYDTAIDKAIARVK